MHTTIVSRAMFTQPSIYAADNLNCHLHMHTTIDLELTTSPSVRVLSVTTSGSSGSEGKKGRQTTGGESEVQVSRSFRYNVKDFLKLAA